MSQRELQRIKVIENAVGGVVSVTEAAELLQLSERQVKRLKRRHTAESSEWVRHLNRGRSPANAIPATTRQQVLELARTKYAGFNDSHLREKLASEEKIALSRQSVRPPEEPKEKGK